MTPITSNTRRLFTPTEGMAIVLFLIFILKFISQFTFDWPHVDDFNMIDWYRRYFVTKEWSLLEIAKVQNGPHWQGGQALLSVLLFKIFGVGFSYFVYINIAVIVSSATLFFLVIGREFELEKARLFALIFIFFIFFSPVQADHILWPYELGWFLVNLSLIANITLIERLKTGALIYVVIISAFSFTMSAQGAFLWLAAALQFSLLPITNRRKFLTTAINALGFVICYATLRYGSEEGRLPTFGQLPEFAVYLLQLLGSGFGIRNTAVCFVLGLVIFSSTIVVLALSYRRHRDEGTFRASSALIFASAGFIAAFGVARFNLGAPWAMHTFHAAPLVVIWYLGLGISTLKLVATRREKGELIVKFVLAAIVLILLVSTVSSAKYGLERANETYRRHIKIGRAHV